MKRDNKSRKYWLWRRGWGVVDFAFISAIVLSGGSGLIMTTATEEISIV